MIDQLILYSELLFYKAYIKHNLDMFSDIFDQYKIVTGHFIEDEAEDIVESDGIFTILMGDHVEPRRNFIVENALRVKNLDV